MKLETIHELRDLIAEVRAKEAERCQAFDEEMRKMRSWIRSQCSHQNVTRCTAAWNPAWDCQDCGELVMTKTEEPPVVKQEEE